MNKQTPPNAASIASREGLTARIQAFRDEVMKVYAGEPGVVDLMLTGLLARGHLLLDGVPGIAKTTLARTFSACLGLNFRRVQFTPDLLPGDITGVSIFDPQRREFRFHEGPVFTQVLLADEINRAPARTQSALLEAMQERQVTVDGELRALPSPFLVLATRNPIEHEGVYPLPEAQLDRFLLRIRLGYPSEDAEADMLARHESGAPEVSVALNEGDLELAYSEVAQVGVSEVARRYIVALARATRADSRAILGASPRAALALQQACRAYAFLQGRTHIDIRDVQRLLPVCWSHRVILSHRSAARGETEQQVIETALERVSWDPV